jgi:hypothetical protein
VTVWDTTSRTLVASNAVATADVLAIVYSSDSRRLAVGCQDGLDPFSTQSLRFLCGPRRIVRDCSASRSRRTTGEWPRPVMMVTRSASGTRKPGTFFAA